MNYLQVFVVGSAIVKKYLGVIMAKARNIIGAALGLVVANAALEVTVRAYNGAYRGNKAPMIYSSLPLESGFFVGTGTKMFFPYSKIIHTNSTDQASLIELITQQVTKNGTLDEIVIGSHGVSNALSFDGNNPTDAGEFLISCYRLRENWAYRSQNGLFSMRATYSPIYRRIGLDFIKTCLEH